MSEELDEGLNKVGMSNQVMEKLIFNIKNAMDSMGNNHLLSVAFTSIFSKVADHRSHIMQEVDKIRKFYLADVILAQMADDSLSPDTSTGDVLSIYSDNEQLQTEIEKLEERIDFDSIAMDIVEDLLAYGEYTLKVLTKADIKNNKNTAFQYDEDTNGIVELADIVDQLKVIPITKHGEVVSYLVLNEQNKIELAGPDEYVSFVIGRRKVRVKLDEEFSLSNKECKDLINSLPRFIRVGRSLLYPIINKIKELELLEQLVPASKLSKILSGTLVGVQMSPGTEVQKAIEACKQIENIINKKVSIDSNKKELTIESITSAAGRFKVVPLFGDKGSLQNLNYDSNEPEDLLSSTKDIREIICDSMGIPFELIFGSDGESKGELLKRYARYLRRLKSIQKAISSGMRQAVCIHLVKCGHTFDEAEVKVEFRNKLIEIDNLDKLEFMDTTVGFLGNLNNFVKDLHDESSIVKDAVNEDIFIEFLSEQFETIGLGGLIDRDAKTSKPAEEPKEPKEEPEEEI